MHRLLSSGKVGLKRAVIALVLLTGSAMGGVPWSVILTEDFDTDGEGSRYTSSAFDDGGSDFFGRQTSNPDPRHLGGVSFVPPQGGAYWSSEDIGNASSPDADNPLGTHGIVRLDDVKVSGFDHLVVRVFLATTQTMRFDIGDRIEIQVAVDDDSGGTDLSSGSYTTIGRFIGDGPDIFSSRPMKLDSDLDGVVAGDPSDAGSPILNAKMQEYVFDVPFSGDYLSVQIRIAQNGGSEEIAFDHIQVQGEVGDTIRPVLAEIERGAVMYTESDPASQVTRTITVSDPDSKALQSATVRITAGLDPAEDVLAASPPPGITAAKYVPSTGTLSLTGAASPAAYRDALRSVTYENTNPDDPSTAIRSIRFQINDGIGNSNFQTRNVQIAGTMPRGTIPHLEDLETDGEGERYTSSTYRSGSDFFERSVSNPALDHEEPFRFSPPQGGAFWASEDVDSGGNPLGGHGILRLQSLDASGLADLRVRLHLGELAGLGEGVGDKIEVQYAMDGDIPSNPTDLSSGNYTTVGRFVPDSPDAFTVGRMKLDTDLDGVTHLDPDDADSASLNATLQEFSFSIPATGHTLSVQIRITQNGGSEELAFDHIRVTGQAVQGSPPTLAGIEGSVIPYGEGDPTTVVTNTIAVADPDATRLASATVRITSNFNPGQDLLGVNGGVPAGILVGPFDPGTGTLSLGGSASPADYEAALRAVTYLNTDPGNPSVAVRTITFQVIDGDGNPSNIQAREIVIVPAVDPVPAPLLEDFKTDGSGVRYTASSFNTGTSHSFFERVTANPDPRHDAGSFSGFTFTSPQGGSYWASEDVASPANALGGHGIIRLRDVEMHSWTDREVRVHLAQSDGRFDRNDRIEIQYALDGDGGGPDLGSGNYTTVGRFIGAGADIFSDGNMTQDANLDGSVADDVASATLGTTMTEHAFPIPDGGKLVSVQIRVEQSGGSEELAIDHILVTGTKPVATVVNAGDSGPGSLRQAIADSPPGGFIEFGRELDGASIELNGGEIVLDRDLTIDGSGLKRGVTVSGGGASRVFSVGSSAAVVLHKITVADGVAPSQPGGGVLNNGSLEVRNCAFVRNHAFGGGAIASLGAEAALEVVNTTITGNRAAFAGAVLSRDGAFDLLHATVSGNRADRGTGGLVLERGSTTIENSVVAGNRGSGTHDLGGAATSVTVVGTNVIGTNDGNYAASFPADGLLIGTNADPVDPLLAPFGRYGGCTGTMHPLAGSPAFDMAVVTGRTPDADQRGLPRKDGTPPDIGALEGGPAVVVQTVSNSGPGSLRQLLSEAGGNPGTRIYFEPMIFPFNGPIVLLPEPNPLEMNGLTVFIDGSGIERGVGINGGSAVRLVNVDDGSAVAMVNLHLREGNPRESPDPDSGAIRINGGSTVNLIDCTVADNISQSRGGAISTLAGCLLEATRCFFSSNTSEGDNGGGAIYTEGAGAVAGLTDCSFTDNRAATVGGAVHSTGGASLFARGCYFSRNAAIDAGAIGLTNRGVMELEDCTFERNEASASGGAILSAGESVAAIIRHCTVVGNAAGTGGGGINKKEGGSLTLENSIVSGNIASDGPDLRGDITSADGVNLIGDPSGTSGLGDAGTDYLVGPPQVAPASDYGGATLSMPPLPASSAVDAATELSVKPDTDQRGFDRPQGRSADIGAVERSELFIDAGPYLINDTTLPLTDTVGRDDTAGDTLFFRFTVDPISDYLVEAYLAAFQLHEQDTARLAIGNGLNPWAYSAFNTAGGGFVDLNSANPEGSAPYEYVRSGVTRTLVFRVDYVPGRDDNVSVWLEPALGLPDFAQEPTLLTTFTANASFDGVRLREAAGSGGWIFRDLEVSELSPFAQAATFGLLHPALDPDQDENGDGLSNYYHYAAGDDPEFPVFRPSVDGVFYTHRRRINASDVSTEYEYSTDLRVFDPMVPGTHFVTGEITSPAPGVEEVTIELLFEDPGIFWRHRFSGAAP